MQDDERGHIEEFYIEPDCCLLCGVPEAIAPEILETGEEQCRLKRQPNSTIELGKTIEAMWSAEADCIRYSGSNKDVLKRLGEAGLGNLADDAAVNRYKPRECTHVRFKIDGQHSTQQLAKTFRNDQEKDGLKVLPLFLNQTKVRFSWYRWHFHSVSFGNDGTGRYIAKMSSIYALTGVGWRLEKWLRRIGAKEVEFLTVDELRANAAGTDGPI
jgi:hypothetical protein